MTDNSNLPRATVGGGIKKVLYTLQKVRSIGFVKATKALTSKNTCKACGLGMGGPLGGMTNESGEFPSVCNKSVQAQSTDIQPPIPDVIFDHSLDDLMELSEAEMASLGRLNTPLYKAEKSNYFTPMTWAGAIEKATEKFQGVDASRSFFYSSGRSSNEAGFLLQLFARLFGTNNVNNCSYYCHQATSVALDGTIGTGTATVELADLANCDLFFLIGANPASNHPRLLHQLKLIREKGGKVIVINPAKEPGLLRFAVPKSPISLFTGGTEIASEYLQPHIGTDYLLLQGIAKAVIASGKSTTQFINKHTEGFETYKKQLETLSWDEISACGISKKTIEDIALIYGKSERTIFAWGMGVTHHSHGVENVEQITNLALLRGMIGKPFSGILPLRGHSNVQGIGTIGVKPVLAEDVLQNMSSYFGVKFPNGPGLDTMASMKAAHNGDVDLAMIVGGNLFASNPNSAWAERALQNIKTKLFLTTTLNRGHVYGARGSEVIILPVTARDEEWQPTTQESMFNFVRLSDGGISRLDNVKPESWLISQIAKAVLPDSAISFTEFESHQSIRKALAKILPELAELESIDVAKKEFQIKKRTLHSPIFNTKSRKASFANVRNRNIKQSTFTLCTVRSEGQFNSIIYEDEDVYRGTKTRWSVMMSPADIDNLGLHRDEKITLRSKDGEMTSLEVVPFDIKEGNLMCYYPEANVLTSNNVDPRSKTPSFKATSVEIIRS